MLSQMIHPVNEAIGEAPIVAEAAIYPSSRLYRARPYLQEQDPPKPTIITAYPPPAASL